MRQPSACRLPAPPRSITLPYSYSLVSRETSEDNPRQQRESPTRARAARSFVAAFVLAALVLRPGAHEAERNAGCVAPRRRTGFSTHVFHVKHASIVPVRPMGIVVLAQ